MSEISVESPSVQSYLGILQSIINRMAANSSGCKTWCVAIVSAILVVVADKGKPDYALLSTVPIVLFFFLDAYYLGLEHGFRDRYNNFVRRLHEGTATLEDVFIVAPASGFARVMRAAGSTSVFPFYTLLAGLLIMVRAVVLD